MTVPYDGTHMQAADNFGYELAALRRSFRYNEYQEMEAQPNFVARVRRWIWSIGRLGVHAARLTPVRAHQLPAHVSRVCRLL
jgi:hypothetical protein